jgi:hypothetical protein
VYLLTFYKLLAAAAKAKEAETKKSAADIQKEKTARQNAQEKTLEKAAATAEAVAIAAVSWLCSRTFILELEI